MHFQLLGRLTRDPESKQSNSDYDIAEISVADLDKKKKGEEYITSFYNVTLFNYSAKKAIADCKKGDIVFITGRQNIEKYQSGEGDKVVNKSVAKYTADTFKALPKDKSQAPQAVETMAGVDSAFKSSNEDSPF